MGADYQKPFDGGGKGAGAHIFRMNYLSWNVWKHCCHLVHFPLRRASLTTAHSCRYHELSMTLKVHKSNTTVEKAKNDIGNDNAKYYWNCFRHFFGQSEKILSKMYKFALNVLQ